MLSMVLINFDVLLWHSLLVQRLKIQCQSSEKYVEMVRIRLYFRPLDVQYSKQVFQNHGCTISDEESTPESTSTSKQLTNKDFMEYFYYTGGVPRYLSWIARLKEY